MSILQEIVTGGVSQKTHTNEVIVFPRPRNETLTRIVFGDRVNVSIREKISNWRTFVDVYWNKNGTLDPKFFGSLRKTVGEILGLDLHTDQKNILQIMREIFSMSDENLLNGITRSYKLHDPISLGFRMSFMIWRDHLEELVVRYNEARTAYIEHHKTKNITNNMKELLKNWKHYNKYYKINSSSKLLLFSNLPKTPRDIPHVNVNVNKWNSRVKKFYWTVDKVKSTHVLQKKLDKYLYLGYCQYKPIYRFNKLLEFPIKELLTAAKDLGCTTNIDYCSMFKKIDTLNSSLKFTKKIPKIKKRKNPSNQELKLKYGLNSPSKYDLANSAIRWYVDEYISICGLTRDYCSEKELYYLRLVKEINKIGNLSSKYFYRRRDV